MYLTKVLGAVPLIKFKIRYKDKMSNSTSQITESRPKVVVVVCVLSDRHPNSILIGKRMNAFGEGTYALPGGYMEFGLERICIPGHWIEVWRRLLIVWNCWLYDVDVISREQIIECGEREIMEETGLKLRNVSVDGILNAVWTDEQHHFITIILKGYIDDSYCLEPSTMEPLKCHGICPSSYSVCSYWIVRVMIANTNRGKLIKTFK